MFIIGCEDSSTAVSVAAMQATAAYINALSDDPSVMQLQCVLTPMLGVMHACLLRGNICHHINVSTITLRSSSIFSLHVQL